jgi:hypothetical protein
MTAAGYVITSLCPNFFGWGLEMTSCPKDGMTAAGFVIIDFCMVEQRVI